MIIPNMQASEFRIDPKKFVRRSDLSPEIRLQIACAAVVAHASRQWGVVTGLSRQYLVSRTFVYMLASTLQDAGSLLFGDPHSILTDRDETVPYQHMLSLRLEGRCSIGAISTIMHRFNINWASTGKISQTLHDIGALLPKTLSTHDGTIQLVVFLSDELFAHGHPILVTVEPQSTALLRIELVETRRWELWKRHWECLEANGYHAIYLVSDGGQALSKAQKKTLKDIFRQPDTYHAIAHRLGGIVKRLERAAYTAIEQEYAAAKTITRASTAATRRKRRTKYTKARNRAAQKIDCYESYAYVYHCLVDELCLFDEAGKLRNRQEAEGNMEAALELLDTLGVGYVSDAVTKVRRTLPDLLKYFEVAHALMPQLNKLPLEQDTLRTLCLAYQWRKNVTKAKTATARQYCRAQEQWYLDVAADDLHKDSENLKEQVYRILDQIVQSSSLVECLNSIIRPYLNTTKNHVTQELLNLIMFYHNHRRYQDGKRKGNTPMEILTGTPQQKDWLDLLFEEVEKKQPGFFGSSQ